MTRLDENSLALHLEVALAGAAPSLLDGLAATDRRKRNAAASEVARHLAERLRCFDFRSDEPARDEQPSLFRADPIGLPDAQTPSAECSKGGTAHHAG